VLPTLPPDLEKRKVNAGLVYRQHLNAEMRESFRKKQLSLDFKPLPWVVPMTADPEILHKLFPCIFLHRFFESFIFFS
jgi:hypothetical protein